MRVILLWMCTNLITNTHLKSFELNQLGSLVQKYHIDAQVKETAPVCVITKYYIQFWKLIRAVNPKTNEEIMRTLWILNLPRHHGRSIQISGNATDKYISVNSTK